MRVLTNEAPEVFDRRVGVVEYLVSDTLYFFFYLLRQPGFSGGGGCSFNSVTGGYTYSTSPVARSSYHCYSFANKKILTLLLYNRIHIHRPRHSPDLADPVAGTAVTHPQQCNT